MSVGSGVKREVEVAVDEDEVDDAEGVKVDDEVLELGF